MVARRIVFAVGVLLAASLGGVLAVRAQSAAGTTRLVAKPVFHVQKPAVVVRPEKARARGTLVAQVLPGRVVDVRSGPAGAVVARLTSRTEFGSPRTFAVTRDGAGRGYAVITTELPNGRRGWVDAGTGALRLSHSPVTLDVDLSSRLLRVHSGDRVLRTMRVGIGAEGSPTPTGRFAITDELRGSAYSSAYGCCILALSGHQTNLPRGWTGGDRLAIHGGSTVGAVSAGCLHAATADLLYLMRSVPLGTQVVIHP